MGVPDKQLFYKGNNPKKWFKQEGYSDIKEFLAGTWVAKGYHKAKTRLGKEERKRRRLLRWYKHHIKMAMQYDQEALMYPERAKFMTEAAERHWEEAEKYAPTE